MTFKSTLGGVFAAVALLAGTTSAMAFSNASDKKPEAEAAAEAPAATESAAIPEGERSMYDGVFTAAQQEAGQAAFMASCASCHGNTARGSSGGPRIIGPVINNKYNGKTVWDYYTYVKDNMPMGAANSLSEQTYADITAFVLAAHGAEAGETALPADEAVMSQIIMGKKP